MRTRYTTSRKGVSTILGTLFFIGIVFSAYVPMTLVMKQADNIYERKLHEARAQDELQYDEQLVVYGYSQTSDEWITVFVQNNGEEVVEIVGIWLNDERTSVSENIASGESTSFDPIECTGSDGDSLSVKVTTSNGNIFSCSLGTVKYSSTNGWYTPSLAICVTIINDSGQYDIEITANDGSPSDPFGEYTSQGTEHDDISKTFLVPDDETLFNVVVQKKVGGGWTSLSLTSPVQVPSLTGNPVVYVVADGTQ
jgi:archaellum component FlaF (FlaF/FlaG flagellin family)